MSSRWSSKSSSSSSSSSSTSSKNWWSNRSSLKKCPKCGQKIDRSLLVDKRGDKFVLYCSACGEEFQEKITDETRQSLTTGSRKYCEREEIGKIEEIGVCDLIQFATDQMGIQTAHFGVCTAVDRWKEKLDIARLALFDDECKVVNRKIAAEKLFHHKAFIYRFLPLDCSSKDETLSRAQEAVKKGAEEWLEKNVGEKLTFEKFANWLKTGSSNDLVLRVHGVINKCPYCKKELHRSVCESKKPIQLLCTFCYERFQVQDTREQIANLRKSFGTPCKTEDLTSIDQLGPADIFKRRLQDHSNMPLYHHFVCTDVDRKTNEIFVIDLSADAQGLVEIQRYSLPLESLKGACPKVFRYLPLDCLLGEDTLKRAEAYGSREKKWEPKAYSVVSNNCQHFASECKTGERRSEDVKRVASSSAVSSGVSSGASSVAYYSGSSSSSSSSASSSSSSSSSSAAASAASA